MKNENHIISDDEAREAELKRSTLELFKECGEHITFIENHPILHDHTYTEILKDSRGAFKQALAGRRAIGSDPYEANGAIALALMHLKSQREMLERLLAQFDTTDHDEKKSGKAQANKGKKRTTRKNRKAACVKGVKFTAEWLAGVLNRSRFQPEKGAGWMGKCTKEKIEQWDSWCSDHPGEENRYGYRTELRTDAGMYDALLKFIDNWDRHWKDYKAEFTKWRKTHANNPRKDFRFRPMRRTDIDPERIGIDADGNPIIQPVSDDQKRRTKHVMYKKGMSTKNLRSSYL